MTINSQGITSRQLLRVIPRLFINVPGCGSFSPENNYLSIVLFVSMDKSVNLAVFAVFAIRYQLNLDPILVPSGTELFGHRSQNGHPVLVFYSNFCRRFDAAAGNMSSLWPSDVGNYKNF